MGNFSLFLSYIMSIGYSDCANGDCRFMSGRRMPLSRELIKAVMDAEDFAKKFYTQQPIDLAFMQDGANTLQASYAVSSMQSAVGIFSAQFATNAATFAVSNFREREDLRQPDAKLFGVFL